VAETNPRDEWRLIVESGPRTGAANMAVDQAIAEACAAGESRPTLRFYRWNPPAVSLGRHQPAADVDTARAAALGYDVVRRTTGGRAILHTDELTYSVAAPESEPRVAGGVMDAYLRLSNALVAGLHQLGVEADKAGGEVRAGPNVSAACFEAPSAYEIVVGGRKLLGSAQSRRAGYVLQHGSLPLVGDIGRLVDVLALDEGTRATLRAELEQRACTLAEALGQHDYAAPELSFEHVAATLAAAFSTALEVTLRPGTLTPGELRRSAVLIREQFGDDHWTHYR
jgi:lipoate-protein ligase A